jgi:hypothetical protein
MEMGEVAMAVGEVAVGEVAVEVETGAEPSAAMMFGKGELRNVLQHSLPRYRN